MGLYVKDVASKENLFEELFDEDGKSGTLLEMKEKYNVDKIPVIINSTHEHKDHVGGLEDESEKPLQKCRSFFYAN